MTQVKLSYSVHLDNVQSEVGFLLANLGPRITNWFQLYNDIITRLQSEEGEGDVSDFVADADIVRRGLAEMDQRLAEACEILTGLAEWEQAVANEEPEAAADLLEGVDEVDDD